MILDPNDEKALKEIFEFIMNSNSYQEPEDVFKKEFVEPEGTPLEDDKVALSQVRYLNELLDNKNKQLAEVEYVLRETKAQLKTLQTAFDDLYYKYGKAQTNLNDIKHVIDRMP